MSLILELDLHLQLPYGGLGALEQSIQEIKTSSPTDMWPHPGNTLQLSSTSFYVLKWLQHPLNALGNPVVLRKLRSLGQTNKQIIYLIILKGRLVLNSSSVETGT